MRAQVHHGKEAGQNKRAHFIHGRQTGLDKRKHVHLGKQIGQDMRKQVYHVMQTVHITREHISTPTAGRQNRI